MEMIELYSRGYGKDPAGIAAEAINYGKNERFGKTHFFSLSRLAKDKKFDVVLVDTAGRMQNDEPLMVALAKVRSFLRVFSPHTQLKNV